MDRLSGRVSSRNSLQPLSPSARYGAKRLERSDEVSWNEHSCLIVPAKTQSEPVAEAVDRKMQPSNPPATKRTSQYFRAPQSTPYVAR